MESERPLAASLLIMTAPAQLPERLRLLAYTIRRAICQRLCHGLGHEVIVLDDQPACAAWPTTASLLPAAAEAGVALRYVALPPNKDGHVNMRLKRNVGLLLCRGPVAVFCDDDDWRALESVQAQLDVLDASGADLCTLQVRHVCELDPRASAVRWRSIRWLMARRRCDASCGRRILCSATQTRRARISTLCGCYCLTRRS